MFHCPACAYQQDFDPSDEQKMRAVFPDIHNIEVEILDAFDKDGKPIQIKNTKTVGIYAHQCPSCKTISPSWT